MSDYLNDDYPTEDELNKLRFWDATFLEEFFEYAVSLWHWADLDFAKKMKPLEKGQIRYKFHTGGWSGNETIISAMNENWPAWALSFYSEFRGGHYEFRFMKIEPRKR